jgi:hypothetical protein
MKKRSLTEWATIAEIISSIAVVVSLIFVAFQLQRNTSELQATHSNDLFDSLREIELVMLASPDLSQIYTKGWFGSRNEMSDQEIERFRMYLMQSINIWEQAFFRLQDGSMSKNDYVRWRSLFLEYFNHAVTREDLEWMLPWFLESFRTEIEANVQIPY